MMKALLQNEWRMLINNVRTQPARNVVIYLISIAVVGVFVYIISSSVWHFADKMTPSIFDGLLSYGLLILIGVTILLGLPYVYKNLYASTDLELLFTMPIPTRYIFWVKYIQSSLQIGSLILFFFGVILTVYGLATGAHLLYYPVLLIVLVAFFLMGLSLTFLANLLVIQVVPASKANEFLTGMSFMTGMAVYLVIMIPNFTSDLTLSDMIMSGLPLFPSWVPVSWGSTAVIEAGQGSTGFIVPLLLVSVLSIILIFIATMTVEKGFRTGWIRVNQGSTKKKKRKKGNKQRVAKLNHPVIAIGKKEWLTIKRDIREWIVFMPLAIFAFFMAIGFFSNGASLSELRSFSDVSWPIAQGMLLFLYAMFNGTMAAYSVGREGVSAWNLNILPISGKTIALGKLWISWLIPFILLTGIEIVAGIILNWGIIQLLLGISVKAIITLGISALGLWFGTFGAKYNPMNPQMRLKFGTSILLFVMSIVYLVVLVIPFAFVVFPVDQVPIPDPSSLGITGILGFVPKLVLTLLKWKQAYPGIIITLFVLIMIGISVGLAIMATLGSAKRFEKGINIDIVSQTSSKPLKGKQSLGMKL